MALNPTELLSREESQLPSYTHDNPEEPFTLTKELFLAPETIFNPALVSEEGEGRKSLIDEIYDFVLSTDTDPKTALATLRTVVLAGGNTWFPGKFARTRSVIKHRFCSIAVDRLFLGFKERLEQDMRAKLGAQGFCKVTAFPKQLISYWRTVSCLDERRRYL